MREIRLSGLEGGVALTRHPYPYHIAVLQPSLRDLDGLGLRYPTLKRWATIKNPSGMRMKS